MHQPFEERTPHRYPIRQNHHQLSRLRADRRDTPMDQKLCQQDLGNSRTSPIQLSRFPVSFVILGYAGRLLEITGHLLKLQRIRACFHEVALSKPGKSTVVGAPASGILERVFLRSFRFLEAVLQFRSRVGNCAGATNPEGVGEKSRSSRNVPFLNMSGKATINSAMLTFEDLAWTPL